MFHMIYSFLLYHPMTTVLEMNIFYFNVIKINTSSLLTNIATALCFAEHFILQMSQ